MTASLMLAVYAIVNGNDVGWTSARTLALLAAAGRFSSPSSRSRRRPRRHSHAAQLFRLRERLDGERRRRPLGRGDVRVVLPLRPYLQLVLGYSPLQVGLAFLPPNLIMAVLSLGLSAKLVLRFGIRLPRDRAAGCGRWRSSRAHRSTASSRSTCFRA